MAYLLDQIRQQGENKELKDEVTSLAREFALVTPYTAYLIMEDEQQRRVSQQNQTMRAMSQDQPVEKAASDLYEQLQSTKTGANAVAASRASNAMKNATTGPMRLIKAISRWPAACRCLHPR